MGFSITGHRPRSKYGEYCDPNCSTWSKIMAIIWLVNLQHDNSLIDSEMLESMRYNDVAGAGIGLGDEQASALARAVQAALDDKDNALHHFLREYFQTAIEDEGYLSDRTAIEARVKELCESDIEMAERHCCFLRDCGGFWVYD